MPRRGARPSRTRRRSVSLKTGPGHELPHGCGQALAGTLLRNHVPAGRSYDTPACRDGNNMLETIKTIGSLAGLVSVAFLIWDRCLRGRPLAGVTAKKTGAHSFTYLRISNPGPAEVFILGVRARPPIYRIAREQSDQALEEVLGNGDAEINLLLRQGEVHDLPIFFNEDTKDEDAPQQVRFLIHWRKASSTRLRQFRVSVSSSTEDIRRIREAVAARRNEPRPFA